MGVKHPNAVMPDNCPVMERTADGIAVGRCYFHLIDEICPRHGAVAKEVKAFKETGQLQEDPREEKASG